MFNDIKQDKSHIFARLLQRDVHEYFDTDARPIGEGRSQAYKTVETQFKSCPYAGSRYQHEYPMSISALNSILPEWQNSLTVLSTLSQRYQQYYQTQVDSYYDLALIAGMGVFLTDYMVFRAKNALETQQIPVLLSGLYKVCLGFQQATFLAMMNDHFKDNAADKYLPDTKGFYAYLEAAELLIGEDEVCGGSEIMIGRAYDVMKGDIILSASPRLATQLTALTIDWEHYDTFSFQSSNLWRKAILFVIQMQDFGIQLNEAALPSDLQHTLNLYFKKTFTLLLQQQSGLAVEIARITLTESGHSLEEWLTVTETFLDEIDYSPSTQIETDASELAAKIITKLADYYTLSPYESVIKTAIKQQLSRYISFETVVLKVFNQHLDSISETLDYTCNGNELNAMDLSTIYGKTLRDFPDIM